MASLPMVTIIGVLIILGLLLWLIGYLPIDARIRMAAKVLLILFVILWLGSLLLRLAH